MGAEGIETAASAIGMHFQGTVDVRHSRGDYLCDLCNKEGPYAYCCKECFFDVCNDCVDEPTNRCVHRPHEYAAAVVEELSVGNAISAQKRDEPLGDPVVADSISNSVSTIDRAGSTDMVAKDLPCRGRPCPRELMDQESQRQRKYNVGKSCETENHVVDADGVP